jgi:transcriptional regulator with XRE-family HTH domain
VADMAEPENRNPMDVVTGIGRDLGRDIEDIGKGIGEYIRQQRASARISLRQLAKLAGVSNPYLSQIERGLRRPSADILQQIAKGLRISAEALYVQAGILDAPAGGPVSEAILAATELTERQKQVLLDVYETFRKANVGEPTNQSTVEGSDVDNLTKRAQHTEE